MGKGGRCVVLTTLPPSCDDCFKSGSLNLLEPSEPVQACNGIALPLHVVVGTATRLLAGRSRFRTPAGGIDFLFFNTVYTGCGAHPSSYSKGTGFTCLW